MTKCLEWIATLLACIGLAIVASGCAHRQSPPCVSRCGMLLEDAGNGSMSCDYLQEAEDYMLSGIDQNYCSVDKRHCKKQMCEAIFGWQLRLDQHVITFIEQPNGMRLPAVGLSNCSTKEMWLGANQNWRAGSYPHEVFHVIQECNTGWVGSEDDTVHGPGHDGWTDAGIYDFIQEVRDGR